MSKKVNEKSDNLGSIFNPGTALIVGVFFALIFSSQVVDLDSDWKHASYVIPYVALVAYILISNFHKK